MSGGRSLGHAIAHNIVARVVLYYAAMAAVVAGTWNVLPSAGRATAREALAPLLSAGSGSTDPATVFGIDGAGGELGTSAPMVVAMAVIAAFLLAVPVAWTYMWTRRTKGYRQSVVHSLILLPVVVAGVVVLVKSSLALAFSLAGIVAAVRFRNTLDDSKDAVFIFFATVLGLASAVQVDAAIVLSVLFIAIVLTLWYSDFARMPPGLEDARAQRQLERAVAIANRTSEFVARVDREVLQAMAPAQLDALASRVRQRRSEADDAEAESPDTRDARLQVVVSNEAAAAGAIERVMDEYCKQWHVMRQRANGSGHVTLEYAVSLRKRRLATELAKAIERDAGPHVIAAEVLKPVDS